jgi:putative CocE/NonD family hydrolase
VCCRSDDSGGRWYFACGRRLYAKVKGRHPAILAFSAYNKELQSSSAPTGTNETGGSPVFTNRGYADVVVARRGVGRSQGESVIFFNNTDVDDHAKAIAWAAEQPWRDGNVVLFGTSYCGITQPQAAANTAGAEGFFLHRDVHRLFSADRDV